MSVFGRQFKTASRQVKLDNGRIDIYANDAQAETIIIELKKNLINGDSINQILKYIDNERKKHPGKPITGILCGSGVPLEALNLLRGHVSRGYVIEAWEYQFKNGQLSFKKAYPDED